MFNKKFLPVTFAFACFLPLVVFAQTPKIINDIQQRTISFGNDKIEMLLDYDRKANLSSVTINGQQIIHGDSGVYSAIKTLGTSYSSLQLLSQPLVKVSNNTIVVSSIKYGDKSFSVNETWTFIINHDDIKFKIDRTTSKEIIAEQSASPVFMFNHIDTWEGAYQDYGGLAWFYLFNKKLDTYGVHSSASQFWNSKTNNGFTISVDAPGKQVAMDYSRTAEDKLAYTIAVSQNEILPRFDSGTQRRLFLRDRTDVWEPIKINAGKTSETITVSWFDFNEKFGRGNLAGVNGDEVNAVLNTIARIGVIDKQHFGGNSWHTPYGPICLHEQYIAQMGLGINDSNYLKGYKECLDFYRDNAIAPDGKVWPRWAYNNEDAMPGKFTGKGFYEAQWGYLIDANPDFVSNVADLYDQTGDVKWVKSQQRACENALDWIIKRDSNNNGLVEMMTDNHTQKRGSDWIDIIWASYENAFVNAKLYHALVLWADIERQLGNMTKEKYYQQFAERLKTSFNKSISAGGFWDEQHQCYIHWRDKDGSIHGTNMVTPVNFMAIAYGICDDQARTKTILDDIETQMQKEQLFFWPLCMYTYAEGEGNDWQFPFPNYENGDIFLSWGSIAVKAYASYDPVLALRYVKNVLARYAQDGLAFQRYGRNKQDGLGDDILSGNALSVVGLYQSIYGINPLYNRLYLDPHITSELAGTQVNYHYRNQKIIIGLDMNHYSMSNDRFKIIAKSSFGFFSSGMQLSYFNGNDNTASINLATQKNCSLEIETCTSTEMSWTQTSDDVNSAGLIYRLNNLKPGSDYSITVNDKIFKKIKSNAEGTIAFNYNAGKESNRIVVAANLP